MFDNRADEMTISMIKITLLLIIAMVVLVISMIESTITLITVMVTLIISMIEITIMKWQPLTPTQC